MTLKTRSSPVGREFRRAEWRARPGIDRERVVPVFAVLLVFWIVAGIEWLWSLSSESPDPLFTTLIAALLTAWVTARTWPELRKLLPAADTRAEDLLEHPERLRKLGWRVFRDVPVDTGNVDQVLVTTHGVFAVTIRTLGRPRNREWRMVYDGNGVTVDGRPPDIHVTAGPRARAIQLRRLLKELTGTSFPVRAVVLYPGWDVEALNARDRAETWVLSPDALPMWIRHDPETVPLREVRAAGIELANYLERFKRA